ncbi:MAG: hypothetical protein LBN95_02435 [Prevotellaceae bacterium]|jgi:hypothetical protein|nr:hypothetical protein [Prevotellaceae bacterium]
MNKQQTISKQKKLRRTERVAFMLNEEEKKHLDFYLKKTKVNNKSKFLRETIIRHVLLQFDMVSPTLFD